MTDGSLICAQEACPALATWFYFAETQRRPVCNLHLSANAVQAFPIAGFHFITHPNKALLFYTRFSEVQRLRYSLKRLKSKAKREAKAALQAMEMNDTDFEMQKYQTLKCLQEVENSIDECETNLPNYLLDFAFQLSDTCTDILRLEYEIPTFQVLKRSQTEARTDSFETEVMTTDETLQRDERQLAEKLLKRAKRKSSIPVNDYLKLQETYQDCCVSIALNRSAEAIQLQESLQAEVSIQKVNWDSNIGKKRKWEVCSTIWKFQKRIMYQENAETLRAAITGLNTKLRNIDLTELQIFNTYTQKATLLYRLGNYDAAFDSLQSANKISKEIVPNAAETVATLNKQACCDMAPSGILRHSTNFTRGNSALTQALAICEISFPYNKEMVEILHNLGICWLGMGDYESAKQVFERALDICTERFPYTVEIVAVLDGLGCVYLNTFLWYRAERCFDRAMSIVRKCFPKTIADFVTLGYLGSVHLVQKRLEEAVQCFTAALKCELGDAQSDPSIFTLYAVHCSEVGSESVAGLELALQWQNNDSVEIAHKWADYGCLKSQSGVKKLGEARLWLERTLDSYSIHYPKAKKTTETLLRLVDLYRYLKQPKSAEQCFETYLTKRSLTPEEIAVEYIQLGDFFRLSENRNDSVRSYKRALFYQEMCSERSNEVYCRLTTEFKCLKQYLDVERCEISFLVNSFDRFPWTDFGPLRNCYRSR